MSYYLSNTLTPPEYTSPPPPSTRLFTIATLLCVCVSLALTFAVLYLLTLHFLNVTHTFCAAVSATSTTVFHSDLNETSEISLHQLLDVSTNLFTI